MDVLLIALVAVLAVLYVVLISWVLAKSQANRLRHDQEPTAA